MELPSEGTTNQYLLPLCLLRGSHSLGIISLFRMGSLPHSSSTPVIQDLNTNFLEKVCPSLWEGPWGPQQLNLPGLQSLYFKSHCSKYSFLIWGKMHPAIIVGQANK